MKVLVIAFLCVFSLLNAAPVEEPDEVKPADETPPAEAPVDAEPPTNAEYGDLFQGDLKLTEGQAKLIFGGETEHEGRDGRTGMLSASSKWPRYGSLVYVPYIIASGHFYSTDISRIQTAMNDIASKTCIRFIPRSSEANYIRIISGSGCWSYLGRIGGVQDLSLQRNGCVYHGTIMHELIHALGYDHMQNHVDRDSRVYINWGNIQAGREYNFYKVNPALFGNYGTSYDVGSVMHYGPYSFSSNGRQTITALYSSEASVMGQRTRLSDGDVQRIKNMYCY